MKKSRLITVVVGMALVAVLALPALASAEPSDFATDTTQAEFLAGYLSMSGITVHDFADVQIDGHSGATFAEMDVFGVTDARGSGEGWNLQIAATQFTRPEAFPAPERRLAGGSLDLIALGVEKDDFNSSESTVINTHGAGAIDDSSSHVIAEAETDEGMGSYVFTPGDLHLSYPASVYAGIYTSDVTITLSSNIQ